MRRAVRVLAGMAVVAGVVLAAAVGWVWQRTRSWEASAIEVVASHATRSAAPEVVDRGRHLAHHVLLCADCHGADLAGREVRGLTMTVIGPNLTPGRGSAMAPLSDDEFATVLRHGVRPDGTAVTGMPADRFQHLSRDDMRALISYLRQLPPVDRELPASSITLVGRASWAFGHVQLQPARGLVDHKRVPLARTPEAPVEHGRYLGKVGGCTACHGRYLSGGRMPGALPGDPSPPNLTMDETGLVGWTRDEFDKAVRQGIGRDGRALTPSMPSAAFAGLSDGEIDALWTYLPTVTPRPYGNR